MLIHRYSTHTAIVFVGIKVFFFLKLPPPTLSADKHQNKELVVSTIQQGLILMIIGMAVVFSFLVILIFVTKFLSFIVRRYFPEKAQPIKLAVQAAHPPASAGHQDAAIAAAIAAAHARSRE